MRGMDDGPGSELEAPGGFLGGNIIASIITTHTSVSLTVALYVRMASAGRRPRRLCSRPAAWRHGRRRVCSSTASSNADAACSATSSPGQAPAAGWRAARSSSPPAYELTPWKNVCLASAAAGSASSRLTARRAAALMIGSRHGACWTIDGGERKPAPLSVRPQAPPGDPTALPNPLQKRQPLHRSLIRFVTSSWGAPVRRLRVRDAVVGLNRGGRRGTALPPRRASCGSSAEV